MTTNKPEVVAWYFPSSKTTLPVVSLNARNGNGQSLIRLADYQRLQADHGRLQAECEKLRKDAERYRWLRSHDRVSDKHEDGMGPPGTVGMVFVSQGDGYAEAEGGDGLDAAIDAAMQGANHGNQ